MTAPTFFTVIADYKSVVVDLASDVDANPQLGPITAKVTFTPLLANGDVILATNASPRPTGYVAAPIVARIDTDGRLKLRVDPDGDIDIFANTAAFPATGLTAKVYFSIANQTYYRWTGSAYATTYPYAAVRLLADTALLELDSPLYYRVTFSEVVFNGASGYIAPFVFEAPSTDVELNLIEVTPVPGTPASGQTKIAPGAVRLEDGDVIFSFAGVDLDDPIPFEPSFDVAEISDSGVIGRELVQAETAASARATIGFADGVKASRTFVDLRDDSNVLAANWKTFLGAGITSGSTTITSSTNSWTAADVGKVVMVLQIAGGGGVAGQYFKSTITAVASSSSATLANAAPATQSGRRVRYGFDGTTAINAALAAVQAQADGPVDVYLGGNYRLTQLIIPQNVILHGVAWHPATVQAIADSSRTTLAQLPGAECDFVIFKDNTQLPGTIGPCGIIGFNLIGPETSVYNVAAATIGDGVSLRVEGSASGLVIDGFQINHVSAVNFPESGFRCFGAVPLYLHDCKALYNGRFGYEHQRSGGSSTNALHLVNFSADWNNLGAVGIRQLRPYDTVFMSGLKLEGISTAAEDDLTLTRGTPGYQSLGVVLDNCDPMSSVLINGMSHIRVVRAETAPGPGITIKDSLAAGQKPRLTFNGVSVRLHGAETGSIADAVTLRDEISSVDIPNTITSGTYPSGSRLTSPQINSILDTNGNPIMSMVPVTSAVNYIATVNNAAGSAPSFQATGSDTNIGVSIFNKGNAPINLRGTTNGNLVLSAVQTTPSTSSNYVAVSNAAAGSTPSVAAVGVDTNVALNLVSKGSSKVQINGVEAVDLSSAQTLISTDVFADALTTGESTILRRQVIAANVPSTSGFCRFTFFTARKTETVTQIRTISGSTAAATSTLCRVGIYSVDGSGNLTLIASIANDATLWAAVNTAYTRSLTASFSKTRGTRYAVGLLFVGTTAPTFAGINTGFAATEFGTGPRLGALTGSNTDLPASVAVGSLTDTSVQSYTVLLP